MFNANMPKKTVKPYKMKKDYSDPPAEEFDKNSQNAKSLQNSDVFDKSKKNTNIHKFSKINKLFNK